MLKFNYKIGFIQTNASITILLKAFRPGWRWWWPAMTARSGRRRCGCGCGWRTGHYCLIWTRSARGVWSQDCLWRPINEMKHYIYKGIVYYIYYLIVRHASLRLLIRLRPALKLGSRAGLRAELSGGRLIGVELLRLSEEEGWLSTASSTDRLFGSS